jgi:hypothetical protein
VAGTLLAAPGCKVPDIESELVMGIEAIGRRSFRRSTRRALHDIAGTFVMVLALQLAGTQVVGATPMVLPDAIFANCFEPAPAPGFGDIFAPCGTLSESVLAGTAPELRRQTFSFERAYVDPDDRDLLTPGGVTLFAIPTSSGTVTPPVVFAYEELARLEGATLLKTETEIVYDKPGKIADFEVQIGMHKLGVTVVRAVAYPLGEGYSMDMATALLTAKLTDIQSASDNVSAEDAWEKQILVAMAYDGQTADTLAQAWVLLDSGTKADTIVMITTTDGDDGFIYLSQD